MTIEQRETIEQEVKPIKGRTPLKKLHEAFTTMFNRDDVQCLYRRTPKHKKAAQLAGLFFTEHGEPISLSWIYRVMREAAGPSGLERSEGQQQQGQGEEEETDGSEKVE